MRRGFSCRTCQVPQDHPGGSPWPCKRPSDSRSLSEISAHQLLLLQLQLSLRISSGQTLGSTGAGPGVPIRLLSGQGRSRVCRSVGDPQPGGLQQLDPLTPPTPTSHFPPGGSPEPSPVPCPHFAVLIQACLNQLGCVFTSRPPPPGSPSGQPFWPWTALEERLY